MAVREKVELCQIGRKLMFKTLRDNYWGLVNKEEELDPQLNLD